MIMPQRDLGGMVFPRDVLNRLRWTDGESLDEAVIWYIHRGAPGDNIRISGGAIRSLGNLFFETEDASIPYHRVLRVDYRGRTLFEKDERAKGLR
jgi:hypothetical protein